MIFIFRLLQFLQYRWRAINAYGIHSPFVFGLYNEVIKKHALPNTHFNAIRKKYFSLKDQLTYHDPRTGDKKSKKVNTIARQTWAGHSFSSFLVRLIDFLEIKTVLEAGTSLGITTSYLSHADSLQYIYTIEGAPEIGNIASKHMQIKEGVQVTQVLGNVYDVFEETLVKSAPQLIFLDADHRSETISFYMNCIKKQPKNIKCIVIHDIYWSQDMLKAWETIVADRNVNLTIDLFNSGLVFLNADMEKQHFTLKK